MESFGLGDRWLLSSNRSHSFKATVSFKPAGSDAVMLIQILLSGLAIPLACSARLLIQIHANLPPSTAPANYNPSSYHLPIRSPYPSNSTCLMNPIPHTRKL